MITKNLRVNELSETAFQNYLEYLSALDARDIEAYGEYLADDVSIQFGNADPVIGKDTVKGMLDSYWQSFAEIEHDLFNIYGTASAFVLEANNHYVRHDGKRVTVKAVAFTDKNKTDKVTSIRIYGDTSPVFAKE